MVFQMASQIIQVGLERPEGADKTAIVFQEILFYNSPRY